MATLKNRITEKCCLKLCGALLTLQTTSNNKGYFYLFSYNSGFFECQDPRVKTRNISLDEFKEQIWKDNVSE